MTTAFNNLCDRLLALSENLTGEILDKLFYIQPRPREPMPA